MKYEKDMQAKLREMQEIHNATMKKMFETVKNHDMGFLPQQPVNDTTKPNNTLSTTNHDQDALLK